MRPLITELDDSAGADRHSYHVTTIARIGGHIVRAHIRRDFYPHQSTAHVDLLADPKTWTPLLDDPPGNWADTVPGPGTGPIHAPSELRHLLDVLLHRAAAVLAPTPPATKATP